jgi:hypothetical protein
MRQEVTANDQELTLPPQDKPTTSPYDAADDPRFDTFCKRLNWFRHKGETDKEFAERLGVSMSSLYRWKKPGKQPCFLSSYIRIGERLDVSPLWLAWGFQHKTHVLPDGRSRLTTFHRFQPFYQFRDDAANNEPRSYYDCRDKGDESPVLH